MEGNRDDETAKIVYQYAISHMKFGALILFSPSKKSRTLTLQFFKKSKIPSIVAGDGYQWKGINSLYQSTFCSTSVFIGYSQSSIWKQAGLAYGAIVPADSHSLLNRHSFCMFSLKSLHEILQHSTRNSYIS